MSNLVQSNTKGQATSSKQATIAITTQNCTAGNMLILVSEDNFGDGTGTQISSISDGNNTWQRFTGTSDGNNVDLEIWYAYNIKGGIKPTLTITYKNDESVSLIVQEYTGVILSDPKDKSVTATGTGTSPASGNTATLSQTAELILGISGWGAPGVTGTASSPVTGYSDLTQENNGSGNNTQCAIADKTVSATTAQSIGMTLSSGSPTPEWASICVTFRLKNVVFLEPGGDADFGVGLWPATNNGPAVATDFVNGSHIKSIKYRPNVGDQLIASNLVSDSGGRFSLWFYINALPSATASIFSLVQTNNGSAVVRIRLTSGGVLQLFNDTVQMGSNGSTLSTGVWYRISFAWTITSTTVNQFRVFKNGVLDITVSNGTLGITTSTDWSIGNNSANSTLDTRTSDHYLDTSTSLTDPGNIYVTAKRPFSNGTTNGFSTQIGSGGSGYGSGHAPQVNERPNSDSNGWSIIGAGSAVTEEYNIESVSQGDINITGATIADYMGWIRSKALVSETGQIIVNNVSTNISLTSTIQFFKQVAGSSSYPSGSGKDIGEITSTTVTTVSLYEAGIVVAYIPATGAPTGFASWASNPISQPFVGNDIQSV